MPTKVHREPGMTGKSRSSKNYITTCHNQGADSQSSSPCCPNVLTSPRLGRPPWYTVTVGSVVWLFGRASRDARSSWHTLHYGHMDECRTFRYTMIQAFLLCSSLSLFSCLNHYGVSHLCINILPFFCFALLCSFPFWATDAVCFLFTCLSVLLCCVPEVQMLLSVYPFICFALSCS